MASIPKSGFLKEAQIRHLDIAGVKASSQDFNQSIFRTLDRQSLDFFWSSTGSNGANHNEWLLYQIAKPTRAVSQGSIGERALIHSVVLANFKSRFSLTTELYPPRQVQIEVGDSPDNFHYRSRIYNV